MYIEYVAFGVFCYQSSECWDFNVFIVCVYVWVLINNSILTVFMLSVAEIVGYQILFWLISSWGNQYFYSLGTQSVFIFILKILEL